MLKSHGEGQKESFTRGDGVFEYQDRAISKEINVRRNFSDDIATLAIVWVVASLVFLALFILAIYLGWGTLALVPITIVFGFLWLINLLLILAMLF